MQSIKVRNLMIGEGRPKICVPIVGRTEQDILEEAVKLREVPADMAEWRVDWFTDAFDLGAVKETLRKLREILKDMPLLFTFRTRNEGGEEEIEEEDYKALNIEASKSGYADLIDVEVFFGKRTGELIEKIHECGCKVIASNHDFAGTPSKDEMIRRLLHMQKLNADILKIAVMPNNRKDVLTLLVATEEIYSNLADRPVITMSMGGLGMISRLSGEIFGSAVTFGSAGKTSAPGQVEVYELKNVLDMIHKSV